MVIEGLCLDAVLSAPSIIHEKSKSLEPEYGFRVLGI